MKPMERSGIGFIASGYAPPPSSSVIAGV